jgi:hypothetical protein
MILKVRRNLKGALCRNLYRFDVNVDVVFSGFYWSVRELCLSSFLIINIGYKSIFICNYQLLGVSLEFYSFSYKILYHKCW